MKKILIGLALILSATTANADFFGGNDGEWKMGPNGPYWDESDWPVWTPMYWMEEMMDSFDNDDDNFNFSNFGFNGARTGYPQIPQAGYGYPVAPYGYGYSYPQAQPAAPTAPTVNTK